jgi:hypothetical protein
MSQADKKKTGKAASIKIVVLGLTCGSIAACPGPRAASIIFNNSDTAITLAYNMRSVVRPLDGKLICPLQNDESQLPRIRLGKPKGNVWAGDTWEYVPGYESILEVCHVRFQLDPGFSAFIYSGGPCSDYKEFPNGAQFQSPLGHLRIQTQDGEIEFTNWETSKQFSRINKHFCLLEID